MAHTNCPNGHDMWNGDGKPVVWAFRVNFFRDYMRNHPECILGSDRIHGQMYDLTDGIPGEDLNCWYCDECGGLTVFVDLFRYDFIRMENIPSITYGDVENWEEYIALRDDDFEAFQDYYEGKTPVEAINNYQFTYKYKLSPDKKTIYAFDCAGDVKFGYKQSAFIEFDPNREIRFISAERTVTVYKA